MLGDLDIDKYITHNINGLENVNQSITDLKGGKCLRAIVHINQ